MATVSVVDEGTTHASTDINYVQWFDGTGKPLVELLVHSGLCPSKGQARKDIEGGGVYVNNQRETTFQRTVSASDLLFGKHLLLRKGKRNYVVLTAK